MDSPKSATARGALFIRLIQQYASAALSLVSVLVLARLLTPADVGVYTIAAVFAGFLQIFRDFGVKDYVIQERELTSSRIAAGRAIIFATSWSAALVLALLSGPIARFYEQDELRAIVLVLAASFLVIPFGAMTQAFLNRELRMGALVRISLTSQIVSVVVAIALAAAGLGGLSLAFGNLANVIVTTLAARYYRPAVLRVRPSFAEVRHVLRFSTFALVNALMMQWQKAAPTLILGKMQSAAAVGLLSRAMSLTAMFQQNAARPVWSVLYPALALSIREGTYRPELVVRILALVTGLAFPVLVFIAVYAESIILVLFGDQWVAAAEPARWLTIFAAATVVSSCLVVVIKAFGVIARNAAVTSFAAVAVTIAMFAVGNSTLAAVGAALSAVRCVELILRGRLASRTAGLTAAHWFRAMGKSSLISLAAGLAALLCHRFATQHAWHAIAELVTGLLLVSMAWLLGVIVLKHPWMEEGRNLLTICLAKIHRRRNR